MVQGVCSNAGKSVIAAGFCRMLRQDGYRVAPFKAQNMSNNSYVSMDGRELGRAQATQAQAAGLPPDARMNPVLLKPCSDVGSQVVLMGKPVGTMRAREYYDYKQTAWRTVREAYDALAAEHEVMVLEGAGSPAEINLRRHDIVNMTMAGYARARVALVGDIDRGGVFASLVGTMALLAPWERDLVTGYILNKFRGDVTLLEPAYAMMHERTGKSILGVVPYLPDLGLPEEDSASFRQGAAVCGPKPDAALTIAVADFPHISNFTDLDALGQEADVQLVRADRPEQFATADAVILPGSKATLADLDWLRRRRLDEAVRAAAQRGAAVVGLCGGFQILGRRIADPLGVESDLREAPGLDLLPLDTALAAEKTLTRRAARCAFTGEWVAGYEIHHGVTTPAQGAHPPTPAFLDEGRAAGDAPLGYASPERPHVWGAYLHGLFDADGFRRRFLNTLRARRGLPPLESGATYAVDAALDRLADHLRSQVDWPRLKRAIGLE